ncbi:hypothetical protein CAPTEDRAFT_216621 [Capitella teleta]|uniref:Uncharacterized protein n=1 Tax=Capitella teleta TaxID=283909 RepID=R7TQV6_CAPTE|nr:hypothetical protein CAPTEDRAFT_216621 [Capitella teleta]|eukprot:ELT93415.1 hypothetical protein CAPTEDRAFT_216621 [Capitella teleta]
MTKDDQKSSARAKPRAKPLDQDVPDDHDDHNDHDNPDDQDVPDDHDDHNDHDNPDDQDVPDDHDDHDDHDNPDDHDDPDDPDGHTDHLRAARARDCFHLPRGNQRILRGQKANVQLANTGGQKFAENKEPESKRIHHCQIATIWKAPILCIYD